MTSNVLAKPFACLIIVGIREPDAREVYSSIRALSFYKENLQAPPSPPVLKKADYAVNTIYFVHHAKALQSKINFYKKGEIYREADYPVIRAFNQYFGQGMASILFQEIREFRSLAYSAYGYYRHPKYPEDRGFLTGYTGTQADKTGEALQVISNILNDLPRRENNFESVVLGLAESAYANRPGFRNLSFYIESWKKRRITNDPKKSHFDKYKQLNLNDILSYYQNNLQDKSLAIGIVGNKNKIDMEQLKKYGRVIVLKKNNIWN